MAFFKPADSLLISTTAVEIVEPETYGTPNIHHNKFQVVHAAGFVTLSQIHVFDRLSQQRPEVLHADELWDGIGEWMIVAKGSGSSEDAHLVASDPFGYRPVFYSLVPGNGLVVADSFRGVIKALSNVGIEPQIDVDSYITALAGTGPQFAYSTSNRTMSREVAILPVRKALVVRNGAVHIVDRSLLDRRGDDEEDFDSLVQKGHDLALDSLSAISRDSSAEHILHLSGGVDSRLILAHLVSAGVAEHFTIRTLDPRRFPEGATRAVLEKDIEISDVISSELGLGWTKAPASQGISTDFMESLHAFQSHSSNYHYNFAPQSRLSAFCSPAVTLRGGGGELLRSTSGGRSLTESFTRDHGSPDAYDRDFQDQWLAAGFTPSLDGFDDARSGAMAVIREALSHTEGESFESRMNDFYLLYRNRAHFGQGGRFAAGNEFSFQILSNVHYVRAMRTLSFSDRSAGSGVKSLFNRLSPELLRFPFEDPRWESLLGAGDAASMRSPIDWQTRFDEQGGRTPELRFAKGYEPGARGERWQFSHDEALSSFVTSAASLLESHTHPSAGASLRSVHAKVLPLLRRQRKQLQRAVTVMASAIDVLRPVGFGGVMARLGDSAGRRERIVTSMAWSIGELTPPNDGWSDTTAVEHQPTLEPVAENLLLAVANPLSGTSSRTQFAFYLKRDGVIVDRRWYTTFQHAVFQTDNTPGAYVVQSFIRPSGSQGPTIWKDSATLVV